VTQVEILKGLQEFGIDGQCIFLVFFNHQTFKTNAVFYLTGDFAERKIRWLSGGQKSRLVLAAAMWHRPHLICLDGKSFTCFVFGDTELTFAYIQSTCL